MDGQTYRFENSFCINEFIKESHPKKLVKPWLQIFTEAWYIYFQLTKWNKSPDRDWKKHLCGFRLAQSNLEGWTLNDTYACYLVQVLNNYYAKKTSDLSNIYIQKFLSKMYFFHSECIYFTIIVHSFDNSKSLLYRTVLMTTPWCWSAFISWGKPKKRIFSVNNTSHKMGTTTKQRNNYNNNQKIWDSVTIL